MRNPYEILGVKEGASKDEIKRAYREMAKKYHPDQHGSNPLRELAEEKMRELNEAYEYLMKNAPDSSSNGGYNSSYSGGYNNTSSNYGGNANYASIRMHIQNGNLNAAEDMLGGVSTRDAEWFFLMGVVHMQKGWYDSAYNYISKASSLDPSNMEYRDALNRMSNQNTAYRQQYYGTTRRDNDMCDLCFKLWCADTLCECCGGDLISCC